MASFLTEEADILVETLSVFNDHESYMRGREEYHRESECDGADCRRSALHSLVHCSWRLRFMYHGVVAKQSRVLYTWVRWHEPRPFDSRGLNVSSVFLRGENLWLSL